MNIAVAQSGGPTSAINASLLGVFKEAKKHAEIDKIYGALNGIEGIINQNLLELNTVLDTEEKCNLLKTTPSSALGSCRFKLPKVSAEAEAVYDKIRDCFIKYDIKAFFYIGGNDSMDTVAKLSKYFDGSDIKIIGIPKTIDNDLPITDHTPGFGSAAKYIAATMREISCDSAVYDLNAVTIVEIMGRDTGWLTASSILAKNSDCDAPHLVYLPERKFSLENFVEDIKNEFKIRRSVIVAVSEGVELDPSEAGDNYQSGKVDTFGHKYLAGIGKFLEGVVTSQIGCKVRSIELNVMQRCAAHIASKTDLDESEAIGSFGVREMLNGATGKMMCFKRVSDNPYKIEFTSADGERVANLTKFFPSEWINDKGNNIKDDALLYLKPLILGEPEIIFKDGLPINLKLK